MRQVTAADVRPEWPVLEPIDGCRGRPIALNKPVCVAGDRARVNLTLPDATVSRAHAIFVSDEHGVYLRDLASLNHVLINDEPVREASLQHGDVLKIGPYAFKCEGGLSTDDAQPASRAPAAELRTADDSIHIPLNAARSTVLGSRDDCDVKMSGGKVSPAHAVIFEMHDRRYIRDLRSAGGTFVNGKKIGQMELHPGDTIRVGDSELVYAAAPAHDPDGTLAGILPEGEAPTADEEPLVVAGQSETSGELEQPDVIPLAEDPEELQVLAREFAEEKEGVSPAPLAVSEGSAMSDSSIIPLLDESEFAPGLDLSPAVDAALPEADSVIPLADSAAPVAAEPEKPRRTPRKRDAAEPPAAKRKRSPRSASDSRSPASR